MAEPLKLTVVEFPPQAILAALPGPPTLAAVPLDRVEELGCERLALNLLGPLELTRYRGFRFAKRQREWLAGRLAAKSALASFLGQNDSAPATSWPTWQINTRPDGRPQLELPAYFPQAPQLSISHSHGLAAALISPGPCGIDIQQLTPSLLKVRPRFVSSPEESLLAASPALHRLEELARLGLLWAAKEAIRKAVELPVPLGFLEMELVRAKSSDGQAFWLEFDLNGPSIEKLAAIAWLQNRHAAAVTLID